MKKTINLGKIDYDNTGKLENRVTIEIEYKEKKEGQKVLSICGNIWNRRNSDILSGDQNLDEILRVLPKNEIVQKIHAIWKKYHLNDMHPECEHQEQLGWLELRGKKVTKYVYKMTSETSAKQRELEKSVIKNIKQGENVQLSGEELELYNLTYTIETYDKDFKSSTHKFDKSEEKTLGWLRETEHPEGILSKPCPVCGYKYGNAWNYRAIPEAVEIEIYKLLEMEV